MKNKLGELIENISKYINYILRDTELLYSHEYFNCLSEIFNILTTACKKIERSYYKYVIYPKLSTL